MIDSVLLRELALDLVYDVLRRSSVVCPEVVERALAGLTRQQAIGMANGMRMAADWLEHPEPEAVDHAANVQALREIAAGAADLYLAA